MLDKLFQSICDLARASDRASVINVEGVRSKVLLDSGGVLREWVDVEPFSCSSTVETLEDIAGLALDKSVCPNPEMYYNKKGVHLVQDRETRRDAPIRMLLHPSDRWMALRHLEAHDETVRDQNEAIRFLRFKLTGVDVDPLIRVLRSVDFSRKNDGRKTVEHGRESLGASVEAKVQGTEDIPEDLGISVAPFTNPGCRGTVRVQMGIHIDVQKAGVIMAPLADEMTIGLDFAVDAVGNSLRALLIEEKVPVYSGAP